MEESQTWENFYREIEGKGIFLFGTGKAVRYLIGKCDNINFLGAIDNDKQKQGFHIGDFTGDAVDTVYENILICDISILDLYRPEDVIVLITSIYEYQEIEEQLCLYGVKFFSMARMEMSRKGVENPKGIIIPDFEQRRKDYVEHCCRKERICDNKILVFIGKYGSHGKNITKVLMHLQQNLDIVWIVDDLRVDAPQGVRLIYADNWKRYIFEMETAHIWLYDIIVPLYIEKRPGQVYIETKHWSSITLKKFYLDDSSTTSHTEAVELIKRNGKLMDYIFCGSEFDKSSCRSGFAFQGEFIRTGSPRTDTLFDVDNREKVYKRYHINLQMHTVLYAPTFRIQKVGNEMKKGDFLDFYQLKETLEECYGGKWCILLRLHPSMLDGMTATAADYVIDVSDYYDSQELVAACDIMISDYSSIMFEPAFIKKPVFLYAPDKQEYIEKERDLLIEYDTLPFPIAVTNMELNDCIRNFDYSKYIYTLDLFMKKYGVFEDGHASKRASEFILKCLNE